ncbi:MAG: hypothetical protein PF495_12190 [Spirochaetales bacterium]|jgi:hypothetical protein|nr:hypothetical protein [Spirochaetales bacterium]
MAIISTVSNHAKYQLGKKLIDLSADSLIIILMDSAFAFDKDTHATLADVTANQLATLYGYTQDTKALTTVVWAEDDTNDKGALSCDNATWTAVAGDIGPTGSYIIYDSTTVDNTVICCVDFGTDYTISDGSSIQIQNIAISLT